MTSWSITRPDAEYLNAIWVKPFGNSFNLYMDSQVDVDITAEHMRPEFDENKSLAMVDALLELLEKHGDELFEIYKRKLVERGDD